MKLTTFITRAVFCSVAIIGLSLVLWGCGGAGVPVPPVETPSPIVLKFVPYEDIRIDFSTISSAAPAAALAVKAVGAGGDYSAEITFGPNVLQGLFEETLSLVMGPLTAFEIPVSETTITFEATGIKIDFGDFDLNGDGVKEGCSGHTAALPVCARVWTDEGAGYTRYAAWVFEAYPTEGNPGKSRVKFFDTEPDGDFFSFAINFDHRDGENKATEVLFRLIGASKADESVDGTSHMQALRPRQRN